MTVFSGLSGSLSQTSYHTNLSDAIKKHDFARRKRLFKYLYFDICLTNIACQFFKNCCQKLHVHLYLGVVGVPINENKASLAIP